jgi:hypothetical protein
VIEEVAASIPLMNEPRSPGLSRAYQRELIASGGMTWQGRLVPTRTWPIGLDRFLLVADDERLPRLLTHDIGTGYEIRSVVVGGEVFGVAGGSMGTLSVSDSEDVSAHDTLSHRAPVTPERRVRLGNNNFAHTLWNHLPAFVEIEELLEQQTRKGNIALELFPSEKSQVTVLGALHELLPMLADRFSTGTDITPSPNTIPLGSTLVSRDARVRVIHSLDRIAVDPPTRPRLWLGVKEPPRAPENLIDFYSEVALQWLRSTEGDVVVDGYTPEAFPVADDFDRRHTLAAARLIPTIVTRVAAQAGLSRVSGTHFRTLRDVLALTATCDYYISCPGTVQHKVGWLRPNTPGMVLQGPFLERGHHVAWHSRMVEGGLCLDELPIGVLEFDDPGVDPMEGGPYDRYRVKDPASAARQAVDIALATLSARRS